MASAVERQPVSSRGSVYSGEIENISDDYALTAGTLCNTDHAGIESSEASFPNYPVTYDIATQVVTPSISRQPAVYEDEVPSSSSSAVGDRFNMPLLFCGAQFDTALPESHSLIPPESVVKPLLAYGASSCYEYHDSDNPGMHLNTLQNTRRVNPTACSVTESDLLSDGSPSSTQSLTEPSSQTSVDITICPYCSNRSFEGESQNRRRNLRRHMLSEHGVDPRLPCHVAGCPATFKPGRFDNLKRHMKQQHGRDSPPASPTGRKRKAIDL